MDDSLHEPWLRGMIPGVDPVVGHLLRASQQIQEDLERAIGALTAEQIRATPDGMTSVGFHARHLAGSTGRLCTYLEGNQLTPAQLAASAEEGRGNESARELIEGARRAFARYEQLVRELTPDRFGEVREVGREKLRTTAIGLAIHVAEHGQRHVGQAIGAAKLAAKK